MCPRLGEKAASCQGRCRSVSRIRQRWDRFVLTLLRPVSVDWTVSVIAQVEGPITVTNLPTTVGDVVVPQRRLRPGLALILIAITQLTIVLDATIVTVALPHIQASLHLSDAGLQWVITAYTLVFGGLLLFGGRLGDLLGRRSALVAGLVVFAGASLFGGLATSAAWLIAARVVQGAGAAVMAPATLALIFENFEEGVPRNRAMSVWAAMSALGGAVGLVAGGLLTTYATWRWTLFVNVPIAVAVAIAVPFALTRSERLRERIDLVGAVTATAGVAALIYALSSAAPAGPLDVSHWGSLKVIVGLIVGVLLLLAFVITEANVRNPLLPLRVLADRNRSGAYLIAACIGVAFFGVLFFLTLFLQEVWGYSPAKAGFAFLPWVAMFAVSATVSGKLLPRFGARLLLIVGAVFAAGGLLWLSQLSVNSTYLGGVLLPVLVTPLGVGLMAVPLASLAMSNIELADAGVASSVLNVGQQVGASIGVAGLGTIAWTVVADRLGHHAPTSHAGYQHALATGFDRGFIVTAGAIVVALLISLALRRTHHQATDETACAEQAEPARQEDAVDARCRPLDAAPRTIEERGSASADVGTVPARR
jgi:EmrB/QacA subfamily drug resistance transporter